MLLLYTKDDCEKCDKVKDAFAERRIGYQELNISNEEYSLELERLGSSSTPYLFDTASNTGISDLDDIIDYASEYSF